MTKPHPWSAWSTQSSSPHYKWTQHWYTATAAKDSCFRIWLALMLMRALPLLLTPKVCGWGSPSIHCCILTPMPRWWYSLTPSIFFLHLLNTPMSVAPGHWQCIWTPWIPAWSHYNRKKTHNFITKERKHVMRTAGLPSSLHLKLC